MKDKKIDYAQYSFRPEENLTIKAGAISQIYQALNELIEKENVGFTLGTDARYEYVHKETSELAKANTKREVLDRDYRKVFSMAKTLESPSTIRVTDTGKVLFSLMRIIDSVRIENLDAGRGTLVTTLQAEAQEKHNRIQDALKKHEEETKTDPAGEDIGLTPQEEKPEATQPKPAAEKKASPNKGRRRSTAKSKS